MQKKKLNILMTAAEAAPLAKIGGLADVVGSLPPALKRLGHDIRLIMPKYGSIDEKKYKLKKIFSDVEIPHGKKVVKINLWQTTEVMKGVKIYFVEHKRYFGKKTVYLDGDNSERFLFFSLAALYSLPTLKFKPDVVHCHDYHTAMITDLIKVTRHKYLKDIKTLYTIHNLQYQGKSDISVLSTGNLTKDSLESLSKDSSDGDINFMVQGIVNADLFNTVSPTYAKEIMTSAYGAKLDRIIKQNKNKLSGIVNGIDVEYFNPVNDKYIKNYSIKDMRGKVENKLLMQKKFGLPQNEKIPVVGLVSRLAWQKGLELIGEDLVDLDCQFVFLGTGHKEYETQLKKLARKYPDKVSTNIMFDIKLAQLIYAASDIFLMPSRFEPCGLGQMIAMRYGTIPVARSTGGLVDTIDEKTGFKFNKFSEKSLIRALVRALNIYYNKPKKWQKMQKNCMKIDFSWNKSAKEYVALYKKLIKK